MVQQRRHATREHNTPKNNKTEAPILLHPSAPGTPSCRDSISSLPVVSRFFLPPAVQDPPRLARPRGLPEEHRRCRRRPRRRPYGLEFLPSLRPRWRPLKYPLDSSSTGYTAGVITKEAFRYKGDGVVQNDRLKRGLPMVCTTCCSSY